MGTFSSISTRKAKKAALQREGNKVNAERAEAQTKGRGGREGRGKPPAPDHLGALAALPTPGFQETLPSPPNELPFSA